MPDGSSRFKDKDGKPIFHFMGCSTMAEYTVLADISCAKISKELPLEKGTIRSYLNDSSMSLFLALSNQSFDMPPRSMFVWMWCINWLGGCLEHLQGRSQCICGSVWTWSCWTRGYSRSQDGRRWVSRILSLCCFLSSLMLINVHLSLPL